MAKSNCVVLKEVKQHHDEIALLPIKRNHITHKEIFTQVSHVLKRKA